MISGRPAGVAGIFTIGLAGPPSGFGAAGEFAFLRSFATGEIVIADLIPADFDRMAQLVEQYADFPSAAPTPAS